MHIFYTEYIIVYEFPELKYISNLMAFTVIQYYNNKLQFLILFLYISSFLTHNKILWSFQKQLIIFVYLFNI